MWFFYAFLLTSFTIPIIFILGRNIIATIKSINGENDAHGRPKVPLGMEATDLDYIERVSDTNAWLSDANGSPLNKNYAGYGPNTAKTTAPLRMGKTGDTYAKNYHKLFGKKSK